MTLGTTEFDRALARQVMQLIPDLSCGTSPAPRHNSYDGLRVGIRATWQHCFQKILSSHGFLQ